MMKIVIIGLGYIGLPTSLMFAKHGVKVLGVDVTKKIVDQLNNGIVAIEEPGLDRLLHDALSKKNFKASLLPESGDVFIIAVPTPNKVDEYGSCDLSYIKQALDAILPYLEFGNTVIIESTVAPRTMEDIIQPFFEHAGFDIGTSLFLVHCPERVLPGQILLELVHNNRIIGGITNECTEKGKQIYSLFVEGALWGTEASVAELSKLMENTYRDVNIALANELVQIGTKLDIDALEVIKMANHHPRVNIHQPGPGVGGHCLAVDPYFIVSSAPKESQIIQVARKINSNMPQFIIQNILDIISEIKGKTITILGLAYKGNVDDIRESPAIEIVKELKKLTDLDIRTYDPYVNKSNTETVKEALENSDLAVILCNHDEFKKISQSLINSMRKAVLFDTKNCCSVPHYFDNYYTLGSLAKIKKNCL